MEEITTVQDAFDWLDDIESMIDPADYYSVFDFEHKEAMRQAIDILKEKIYET